MKKLSFLLSTITVLFFCNQTNAQEDYKQYLNTISNSLPEVYLNTNASLYYTIQVGAYRNKNLDLQSVNNINITPENDIFKYRLGKFTTYKEAIEFKNIIKNVCTDAFIVPIKNGERIHIKVALKEDATTL
ncbi:hypothetical protein [Polaribacter sp.]|uniref:hypothetical protein n=1 Tax=Polaribacter sp. TaxID=1920175 RepID=UPI003F6D9277